MCRLDYDVSKIVEIITNVLDLNISDSLKYKLIQSDIDRLLLDAADSLYKDGFDDGYDDGFDAGFEQAKDELGADKDG